MIYLLPLFTFFLHSHYFILMYFIFVIMTEFFLTVIWSWRLFKDKHLSFKVFILI